MLNPLLRKDLFTATAQIFFFVNIVFFYTPLRLYVFNAAEFEHDLYILIVVLCAGAFLFVFLLTFFLLLQSKIPKTTSAFCFALFILGITILLDDLVFPSDIGLVDGTDIDRYFNPTQFLIEGLFIANVCLIGLYGYIYWEDQAKGLASLLSGVFLVLTLLLAGSLIFSNSNGKTILQSTSKDPIQSFNIYHFHLDAMQTDFFLHYLESKGVKDRFYGFTIFPKATTSYPYTTPSVTSYLSSQTFKGGDYMAWLTSRQAVGLFHDAAAAGYHIDAIYKPGNIRSPHIANIKYISEIFNESTKIAHVILIDFITIWFSLLGPDTLKSYTWNIGKRVGGFILSLTQTIPPIPRTINEGYEPYTGVKVLEHVTNSEERRPSRGQYLFVQAFLPHGPYVIDRNCKFDATATPDPWGFSGEPNANAYLDHVVCAGSLMIKFLEKLKDLGRYDESLIIIHGDHGSTLVGNLELDNEGHIKNAVTSTTPFRSYTPWTQSHLRGRFSPLLMIKKPNATHALKIDDANAQLLDLYPTIAKLLSIEIEQADVEGIDLFNKSETSKARDIFVFYYKPGLTKHKDIEKFRILRDSASNELEFKSVGRFR